MNSLAFWCRSPAYPPELPEQEDLIEERAPTLDVSFKDFIYAAQNAGAMESLVYQDGRVTTYSRRGNLHEPKEELIDRTWDAFLRCLNQSFSPERLTHITRRYRTKFEALRAAHAPLRPRYVEAMGIGASVVTVQSLRECAESNRPLSELSDEELRRLYLKAEENKYLGMWIPPQKITGGPKSNEEYFAQVYSRMDRRRAGLFEGVENLVSKDPKNIPRLHPYYQRLNMGIASLLETDQRYPDVDIVIPAPGEREGELSYYYVNRVISAGGLNAFALAPISRESHLTPLLVFRCTKQAFAQHEAVDSMLNDIEDNMGESGYKAAKAQITALLEDPNFTRGKKPAFISYSLGGSHATFALRDHLKEISEFVMFNGCGARSEVVESIAYQYNSLPEAVVPPPIYVHQVKGDNVNHVGGMHVGKGITHPNALVQVFLWEAGGYELPDEDRLLHPVEVFKWLNLHAFRGMDQVQEADYTLYQGRECEKILDSYKRNKNYEDVRRQWGVNFFYHLIKSTYYLFDLFLRIFEFRFPARQTDGDGIPPLDSPEQQRQLPRG